MGLEIVVHVVVASCFVARVVQTRRWLAGPIVAAYTAGLASVCLINSLGVQSG